MDIHCSLFIVRSNFWTKIMYYKSTIWMGVIYNLGHVFSLSVLYAFFGLRLLYIAWKSDPKSSQKKEMEEVYLLQLISLTNFSTIPNTNLRELCDKHMEHVDCLHCIISALSQYGDFGTFLGRDLLTKPWFASRLILHIFVNIRIFVAREMWFLSR